MKILSDELWKIVKRMRGAFGDDVVMALYCKGCGSYKYDINAISTLCEGCGGHMTIVVL